MNYTIKEERLTAEEYIALAQLGMGSPVIDATAKTAKNAQVVNTPCAVLSSVDLVLLLPLIELTFLLSI